MPWVMIVDSKETTGRPLPSASATAGDRSRRALAVMGQAPGAAFTIKESNRTEQTSAKTPPRRVVYDCRTRRVPSVAMDEFKLDKAKPPNLRNAVRRARVESAE